MRALALLVCCALQPACDRWVPTGLDRSIYDMQPAPPLSGDSRLGVRTDTIGPLLPYHSGLSVSEASAFHVLLTGPGYDRDLQDHAGGEWRVTRVDLATLTASALRAPPTAVGWSETQPFRFGKFQSGDGLILIVEEGEQHQLLVHEGDAWTPVPTPSAFDERTNLLGHGARRLLAVRNGQFSTAPGPLSMAIGGVDGWREIDLGAYPDARLGPWGEQGVSIIYSAPDRSPPELCLGLIDEAALTVSEAHCGDFDSATPRTSVNGSPASFVALADTPQGTLAIHVADGAWSPFTMVNFGGYGPGSNVSSFPSAPGWPFLMYFEFSSSAGAQSLVSLSPEEVGLLTLPSPVTISCAALGECERGEDPSCDCLSRTPPAGAPIPAPGGRWIVQELVDVINAERRFHVQLTPKGELPGATACLDMEGGCSGYESFQGCSAANSFCDGEWNQFFSDADTTGQLDSGGVLLEVTILGEETLDALVFSTDFPTDDPDFSATVVAGGVELRAPPGSYQVTLGAPELEPPGIETTIEITVESWSSETSQSVTLSRGLELGVAIDRFVSPAGGAMLTRGEPPLLIREHAGSVVAEPLAFQPLEAVWSPDGEAAVVTTQQGLSVLNARTGALYGDFSCSGCVLGGPLWGSHVEFSPDSQCAAVYRHDPVRQTPPGVVVLCWDTGALVERVTIPDLTTTGWFSADHSWYAHVGEETGFRLFDLDADASYTVDVPLGMPYGGDMAADPSALVVGIGQSVHGVSIGPGPTYSTFELSSFAASAVLSTDGQTIYMTHVPPTGMFELLAYDRATTTTSRVPLAGALGADLFVVAGGTGRIDERYMWLQTQDSDAVIDLSDGSALYGFGQAIAGHARHPRGLLVEPDCPGGECALELFDTAQGSWISIPRFGSQVPFGASFDSAYRVSSDRKELILGTLDAGGALQDEAAVAWREPYMVVQFDDQQSTAHMGAPCIIFLMVDSHYCVWR